MKRWLQQPSTPAKPCEILRDGEVIVEGRWSQLFGFIEVD